MAAQLQEISIVFIGEKWRSPDEDSDFMIGFARLAEPCSAVPGQFSILGDAPRGDAADRPDGLQPQLEYRLYGHWSNNDKFGRQFAFKTFVKATPHGRAGVIRYLSQCPNIGQATATALWNKFQSDAVRIVRESPDVAAVAIGRQFTAPKAEEAAAYLQKAAAIENVTIQMIDLLGGRGFPKSLAKKCIEKWGNNAPAVVHADPYKLMKFKGVWWLKADAFYCDLGLPQNRLKRQAYCATYCVIKECDKHGHTWRPIETAKDGIKAHVGGVEVDPDKALMLASRGKILAIRRDESGQLWAADRRRADAERYVAERIAEAMGEDANWPEIEYAKVEGENGATLHQYRELIKACRRILGVFGGSPGTGKTYTIGALARAIIAEHGIGHLAIAAPTGKAAVRCTESLANYGIAIQATTIHRLLVVESSEDGWSFKHNERLPLPWRFIIVDEVSMVDANLMASLLAARAKGAHLLFVGDVNQLPPVGHGAPLRDFIAAGLPYGELREIKRNAGTIVKACASIRDNEPFQTDEELQPFDAENPKNLKLIPAGRQSAPDQVLKLVEKIRAQGKVDPVWDVQVVVAVNARSQLSRKALNGQLQGLLNPAGKQVSGSPFRVGDKVIQLKNGFLKLTDGPRVEVGGAGDEGNWLDYMDDAPSASGIDFKSKLAKARERLRERVGLSDFGQYATESPARKNDDTKAFVANGEIGRVLEVAEKKTIVEFSNPKRIVLIPRGNRKGGEGDGDEDGSSESGGEDEGGSGTGCDLDLAYAVTCHKLQGSQAPIVIVALDEYPGATGQFGICDRSWLYTAISRAEKVCFLVGKISTARTMCERQSIQRRKTFLVELIHEYAASFGVTLSGDASAQNAVNRELSALPPDQGWLSCELDAAESLF